MSKAKQTQEIKQKQEKVINFIELSKQQIKNLRLKSGDYCVMVFINGVKAFVYKSLPDFEAKFSKKISNLKLEDGIEFELWGFD